MRRLLLPSSLALAFVIAACADQSNPVDPGPEPGPDPDPPIPLGIYEFTVTGIGTDAPSTTVRYAGSDPSTGGASGALNPILPTTGVLQLEAVTTTAVTDGPRPRGQRYVSSTFRVRNSTGMTLNNVTFIPVSNKNTISNTPFLKMLKFDESPADTMIARRTIPTGVVTIGPDLEMQSPVQDVLQVFDESEVAAITLPPLDSLTNIFPYGFVVRSKYSTANRTLPPKVNDNDWGGLFTWAFRIPLQPNDPGDNTSGAKKDAYTITWRMLAVQDTEVRLTESIEESRDSAAVTRLRARATALGATTVTVLAGSPTLDPAVLDYPGQRFICQVRTAGFSASPVTRITNIAAYSQIMMLLPGESIDKCSPYFRAGTPGRPATNVPFTIEAVALDRYGNVVGAEKDTIALSVTGAPASLPAPGGYVANTSRVFLTLTYTDYGNSILTMTGKRLVGSRPIGVHGVTRTWTAASATTNWHTGGNWGLGAVPMSLDSVYVPASAPFYPALAANVSVLDVTVENGATLSLNAFDLTSAGNVSAGLTGGITNTTGRLVLTGTAKTLQGRVPRLRVTGTYSLTGNVTARAPLEVAAGRLTSSTFRLQAESN
ncbi:MAG TPA: hypothetical protein VFR37_17590 [Longimicrobium sp.]|nr:hypothetical protein [Longimicrobium sp.]